MKRHPGFPVRARQVGCTVDVAYDVPTKLLVVTAQALGMEPWAARVWEFNERELKPVGKRYSTLPAPHEFHFRFTFPTELRAQAYARHYL